MQRGKFVRRVVRTREHPAYSRFVEVKEIRTLLKRAKPLALVPLLEHGASLHVSPVASSDNALKLFVLALAK